MKNRDGHCRIVAINNALGRDCLSPRKFSTECDKFRKQYPGIIKTNEDFAFSSDGNNIISWMLNTFHKRTVVADTIEDISLDGCIALIPYTYDHVWAVRNIDGIWYECDGARQKKLKHIRFLRSYVGIILVYDK